MSLDWNVEDVNDYENLCWIDNPKADGKRVNYITESLIFATMSIGINKITEDNVFDFYLRSVAAAEVYGKPLIEYKQDESNERNYTLEEVKQHIGLRTNAQTMTDKQFMNSLVSYMKRYKA